MVRSGWRRIAARADRALARMTPAQSIAIGEALLRSDIMRIARPTRGPRPPGLRVALGLDMRPKNR